MRRTAYLKALDEANKLPERLKELDFFKGEIILDPMADAIHKIKDAARKDDQLFHCELIDVLSWNPSKKVGEATKPKSVSLSELADS